MPSIHGFFSDDRGRLVIAQRPNLPLVAWAVSGVGARLLDAGRAHEVMAFVSAAFLFTWAWLELTDGDSPFRRMLGAVVLAGDAGAALVGRLSGARPKRSRIGPQSLRAGIARRAAAPCPWRITLSPPSLRGGQ